MATVPVKDIEMVERASPKPSTSATAAQTALTLQLTDRITLEQVDERPEVTPPQTYEMVKKFWQNQAIRIDPKTKSVQFNEQNNCSKPVIEIIEHESSEQAELSDVGAEASENFSDIDDSRMMSSMSEGIGMVLTRFRPIVTALAAFSSVRRSANGSIKINRWTKSSATWDYESLKKFSDAIYRGDINCLEKILTAMASDRDRAKLINTLKLDKYDKSPLHWAVQHNNILTALVLINQGADVEICDSKGRTPMHYFARNCTSKIEVVVNPWDSPQELDSTMLHELIKAGADVNARDKLGQTPLHEAVISNKKLAVARLLGLPNIRPNIPDCNGWLPLHYACGEYYSPQIAGMLLEYVVQRKNLKWDTVAQRGISPLHIAIWSNHSLLVTEILNHEICTKKKLVSFNDKDENGDTTLHCACKYGRYEICAHLLKRGAVRWLDTENKDGDTPLDVAARKGYHEICALLFGYQDPEETRPANTRAFLLACDYGHVETVRFFVRGCTLLFNITNFRPRDFNVYCSTTSLISSLAERFPVEVREQTQPNFLFRAITEGRQQVANYIVRDSPLWQDGLRNRVIRKEDKTIDTPMRALVRTMPEVAWQVLNRCTDITETEVGFRYEFIDDAYSAWKPEWNEWNGRKPAQSRKNPDRLYVQKDSPYTKNGRVLQKNHILTLMMDLKRDDLLKHPLVFTLVQQKWRKFGRLVFLTTFVGYLLYLMLLTAYSTSVAPVNSLYYLSTPPDSEQLYLILKAEECNNFRESEPLDIETIDNETDVCRIFEQRRTLSSHCSRNPLFTHNVRLVLLLSSLGMLAVKLALLFTMHAFDDILACCVYTLTIVVTFPWHGFDCLFRLGLLQAWAWQVASVNILLAYVYLAMKLKFAPGLSIYVYLLKNVSVTMLRVLLTGPFGIILIALALCFYMIFKASMRHDQHVPLTKDEKQDHIVKLELNPFHTVPIAIMKTLVMFIGEYDSGTHFTANDGVLAPILLILLILFGTIALMNLLIGLATSDVGTVAQDQAEAQQLKMQIKYALGVERLLRVFPFSKYSYFKNLVRSDYILYYSLDGTLLRQTNEYTPDNDVDKNLSRPDRGCWQNPTHIMTWEWFSAYYNKIFVDPRYRMEFSARFTGPNIAVGSFVKLLT